MTTQNAGRQPTLTEWLIRKNDSNSCTHRRTCGRPRRSRERRIRNAGRLTNVRAAMSVLRRTCRVEPTVCPLCPGRSDLSTMNKDFQDGPSTNRSEHMDTQKYRINQEKRRNRSAQLRSVDCECWTKTAIISLTLQLPQSGMRPLVHPKENTSVGQMRWISSVSAYKPELPGHGEGDNHCALHDANRQESGVPIHCPLWGRHEMTRRRQSRNETWTKRSCDRSPCVWPARSTSQAAESKSPCHPASCRRAGIAPLMGKYYQREPTTSGTILEGI